MKKRRESLIVQDIGDVMLTRVGFTPPVSMASRNMFSCSIFSVFTVCVCVFVV